MPEEPEHRSEEKEEALRPSETRPPRFALSNSRVRFELSEMLVWAIMVGFVAIVAAYFVYHKPITPELVLSLVRILWVLLVAFMLFSLAGGLGVRLLPRLDVHPLALLSLQAAFGAGCLALGMLAAGLAGLLFPWVAAAAILILVFLLRKEIRTWWMSSQSFKAIWNASSRIGRWAACILLGILVAALLTALAPPLHFDALVYHLTLPKIYLDTHQISYIPENMFWGMPQTAEMFYTFGMSLGGLSAGPALGWLAGLLAILGLLGHIAQKFGADAGWVGVAALLAGFTLAAALGWGYADWWTLWFGLGFLIFLTLWDEQRADRLLGLAGICAGFALGTKYTAGVALVSGFVIILFRQKKSAGAVLKSFAWLGLPALLVFSPWLLKNFFATGNPIYPLLFPGGAMTPYRIAYYHQGEAWGNWLDVVLLPLRSVVLGVYGAPGYNASIGPLLLGLSLAAGVGWRRRSSGERSAILIAAMIILTAFAIWMAVGRFSSYLLQSRLYYSVFPAYAFLAAAGYSGLSKVVQRRVRLGVVAGVLTLVVFGLNAVELSLHTLRQNAFQKNLGLETSDAYFARNLGWFEPTMRALRSLPESSRVLMLFEPRSLYCLPVCEPDEALDRWLRERHDSSGLRDAQTILQGWKARSYTHVLFHKAGAEFLRKEDAHYERADWASIEELLASLEPVEEFGDAYALYRLPQ